MQKKTKWALREKEGKREREGKDFYV